MEIEQLDIFTEDFVPKGTASRQEVHEKGEWHQTFHCHVVKREKDGIYILFQRRHPEKKVFPDCFDIAVAGHLMAGESPAAGIREIEEEIGLKILNTDLHPIGLFKEEIHTNGLTDREFCHVYYFETDAAIEQFSLQTDEVTGIVKIKLDDAIKLFTGKVKAVEASGFSQSEDGSRKQVSQQVGKHDFAYHIPEYYPTVFSSIQSSLAT
jgi:isopentenyldiphosphate isomerase